MRKLQILIAAWSLAYITYSVCMPQSDPVAKVSHESSGEMPINAVTALALQSDTPIGIVLGADQHSLCSEKRKFDIKPKSPMDALAEVARLSNLSFHQEDGVVILSAADVTPLQQSILDHRFLHYPEQTASSMAGLGARLTGAIRMDIGDETTFAASVLHSPGSQRVTISDSSGLSVKKIANRIVNSGKHGLWIFHGAAPTLAESGERSAGTPRDADIKIYSYADDREALVALTCDR